MNLFRWRHLLRISPLVLSMLVGSSLIITAFYVRHKLQVLPLQKFSETDATIFQVKLKSVFDSLSFQINCERAVS